MSQGPIRVLLIEDSPVDALLLSADFSRHKPAEFRLTTASRLDQAIQILATSSVDVILLDLFLEDSAGLETLASVHEAAPGIPVVIITGLNDEEEALRALQHGAQDYLIKGDFDSRVLFRAVRYAIERKQSEERYRDLFENANDAIYTIDMDGRITSANRAWRRITGYDRSGLIGKPITAFVGEPFRDTLRQAIANREAHPPVLELELISQNGGRVGVEVSTRLVTEGGTAIGFQGIARDLTERKAFEQRLFQKQKLEAVGTLAGGVAHNFNNALTIILGYCNLLLEDMPADAAIRKNIESIKKAAERAALLTRQLHAFARKKGGQPTPISLNNAVTGMQLLLESVLGENIILQLDLAPQISPITADPIQIEQILMNLAVNSCDAMPAGGTLTIATKEVRVDFPAEPGEEARSGSQVLLTFTDTGCGMTPEICEHIFEPFFTTKGLAQASGLGLSIVYGLVKQNSGVIAVSSEPGRGTTFTLAFPSAATFRPNAPGTKSRKDATILVVEDEDPVRDFLKTVLSKRNGYTVLTARGWAEAIEACFRHDGRIDLLITDMVMPPVNGSELARRLKRERPEMNVIYMSGYSPENIPAGKLQSGVSFLEKPVAPAHLLETVEHALAASQTGAVCA